MRLVSGEKLAELRRDVERKREASEGEDAMIREGNALAGRPALQEYQQALKALTTFLLSQEPGDEQSE